MTEKFVVGMHTVSCRNRDQRGVGTAVSITRQLSEGSKFAGARLLLLGFLERSVQVFGSLFIPNTTNQIFPKRNNFIAGEMLAGFRTVWAMPHGLQPASGFPRDYMFQLEAVRLRPGTPNYNIWDD